MTIDRPRIVATKRAFTGWNTLDIVTVETDGAGGAPRRHEREIIDHGSAAVVLVIDRERGVAILVRQWRTGLLVEPGRDPFLLEACAGIVEPGETPEEAARREAEEEVGVRVRALRSLGSVVPSVGTLTERMHLYVAEVSTADRTGAGGGVAHEGEEIEVVEMPLDTLFAMAGRGEIEDAKTLVILQRLLIETLQERCPRPENK